MNLLDLNLTELTAIMTEYGVPKYRAEQVFRGLYAGKNLNEITTLPKALVEKLEADGYVGQPAEIVEKLTSSDGTSKFLFKYRDGNVVEGVLMKYKYGNTLCVSTQAGCRMGCAFCASGLSGLICNLTAGQILAEVILVNSTEKGENGQRAVTNVVLMGCGEPLDNYDNVSKFLYLVSAPEGLGISQRNISLSTCGLVPNIDRLIADNLHITLTISLHAPNNGLRDKIMPVNKAYPIEQLIPAAKRYFEATGRRVVFEYALIKDFNDGAEQVKELTALLKGFSTHINLIPLNYVKERGLKGVDKKGAQRFCDELVKAGMSATVRRTMGNDIEGACGQLRRKYIGD